MSQEAMMERIAVWSFVRGKEPVGVVSRSSNASGTVLLKTRQLTGTVYGVEAVSTSASRPSRLTSVRRGRGRCHLGTGLGSSTFRR
jgi:hypothetical protein